MTIRSNVVKYVVGILKKDIKEIQEFINQQLEEKLGSLNDVAHDIESELYTAFENEREKVGNGKLEGYKISSLYQLFSISGNSQDQKTNLFAGIPVETAFEIPNGMTGMRRDVVLRVCSCLWDKPGHVRTIIGMSETHFLWKEHAFFVSRRPKRVCNLLQLSTIPTFGFRLSPLHAPSHCVFLRSVSSTVFLKTSFTTGVWQWAVQIAYQDDKIATLIDLGNSYLCIGAAEDKCRARVEGRPCGSEKGSASFYMWRSSNDACLGASLCGVNGVSVSLPGTAVPNNSFVTMEADLDAHTLCFFVGEKIVPAGFEKVPASPTSPLLFGMSGGSDASFTSVFLHRLPGPSAAVSPSGVRSFYAFDRSSS